MNNKNNPVQSKELTTAIETTLQQVSKVLSQVPLLSRITTIEEPLKVIDEGRMNYIVENLSSVNQKMYVFCKRNTQTMAKLMTLTMLYPAGSPYKQLQQILAEIENRQMAITENIFNLKEKQLEIKELKIHLEKLKERYEQETDPYKKALLSVQIEKLQTKIQKTYVNIANSFSYLEAALKELGLFLEMYEEIKRNNNIPDDWDEEDLEREEVRTNIKNAFRLAVRDMLSTGMLNVATSEYFEQFGISPIEGLDEVTKFLTHAQEKIANGENVDYDEFYDWLESMAVKYKDRYKRACKRLGLSEEIVSEKFTLKLKQKQTT